jgi:putative hydrolase of the HAD superfamily
LPVRLLNDARAITLGEWKFGAGRGVDTLACFAIGTGIGSGLVINGTLHLGIGGTAGELGHQTIDFNGPLCGCGNHGCLEAYASGPAIAAMGIKAVIQGQTTTIGALVDHDLNRITSQVVSQAASQGDRVAIDIYAQAGEYIGIAASLCDALRSGKNPAGQAGQHCRRHGSSIMGQPELIAFDADDTLWENEAYYRRGRQLFLEIIQPYPQAAQFDDALLNEIEMRNLPYFGYGIDGFIFSLLEAAIQITGGRISGQELLPLLEYAREMVTAEIQLFPNVQKTLELLASQIPLLLITKGATLHQKSKVDRSGLAGYFMGVEVVDDKNNETYASILERYHVTADQFLMVGNSMRSDILPVLELGGTAVYIPNALTWSHEQIELPANLRTRLIEIDRFELLPEALNKLRQGDRH